MGSTRLFFAGMFLGISMGTAASIAYVKNCIDPQIKNSSVYSVKYDKQYPILDTGNELVIGTSKDNIQWLQQRANYEGQQQGKQSMQSRVRQLEEENKGLQGEVRRNKMGNFIDGIEKRVRGN